MTLPVSLSAILAVAAAPVEPHAQVMQPYATSVGASSHVVVDLGLSKAGTSSFADYAWRTLGLVSWHNNRVALKDLAGWDSSMTCQDGTASNYPDYAAFQTAMNATGRVDAALSAQIGAWADTPTGLLLEAFERAHGGTAKYVIWPRNSTSWANSFEEFFCDEGNAIPGVTANVFRHTFGLCDPCDLAANRSEVRAANMATVKAVYEKHLANVYAYFGADPARAERFHTMDFYDPFAGRALCEFIFSSDAPRCVNLTDIPNVDVEDLSDQMESEAKSAWMNAIESA